MDGLPATSCRCRGLASCPVTDYQRKRKGDFHHTVEGTELYGKLVLHLTIELEILYPIAHVSC
jgi:hypothetical protein